jgi:hypothetical protein
MLRRKGTVVAVEDRKHAAVRRKELYRVCLGAARGPVAQGGQVVALGGD